MDRVEEVMSVCEDLGWWDYQAGDVVRLVWIERIFFAESLGEVFLVEFER